MTNEPASVLGRTPPDDFGLTKRELFAAMAMQGLLAGSIVVEQDTPELTATIARTAVASADALLAALKDVSP
jgi:hypothetical protein